MTIATEKREARDAATAPERLGELAQQGVALARLVATNEAAPGSLLRELADHADRAVRRQIARNPATPAKVAARVGSEFPNDLLDNPAFDLYLIEEPDLLDGIGETTLRALLKRERCPAGFFAFAMRKQDASIAMAMLTNPSVPQEIVREIQEADWWSSWGFNAPISGLSDGFVREAAAFHQSVAEEPEWREQFEGAVAAARLHAPAKQAHRSLARMARITATDDEETVEALMPVENGPGAEAEPLHRAALRSPIGRRALAKDSWTPTEILRELVRSVDTNTAGALLDNDAAAPLWTVDTLTAAFKLAGEQAYSWSDKIAPELLVRLPADEFAHAACAGLARLSVPPEDIQPLLADERTRAAIACHPGTPPELLNVLVDVEPRAVASNPSAPPELLRQLADGATLEMRVGLARNSASPPDLLIQLGRDSGAELTAILVERADAPAELLASLAQDAEPAIRAAVARHPHTDWPTLTLLAEDPDPGEKTAQAYNSRKPVRAFVAANPNTPPTALARLASDPDEGWEFSGRRDSHWNRPPIREVVAINPSANAATLDRLARTASKALVWQMISNSSLTTAQLLRWLRDPEIGSDREVRGQILSKLFQSASGVSEGLLESLVDELTKAKGTELINYCLNKGISPTLKNRILQALAAGPDRWARRSVAQERSCPPALLVALAKDPFEYVRSAVAENRNTPIDALERLALDDEVEVRTATAANSRTPPSILADMAEAEEERIQRKGIGGWKPRRELEQVHAALARNRRTPSAVLERLAAGSDLEVLVALAKRASVPRELRTLALTRLALGGEGQEGEKAIRFAASHADTPIPVLEGLLTSPDREISRRARANKALGRARKHSPAVDAIRVRPGDAERIERALDADDAASALAALRAEWLDELARPNVPSLSRLVALMQPDCPPGRLAKAQRSVWWPERCAIADNPNTPLSTVRRLADDANVVVRAAAREALAQRQADGEL